MKYPINNPRKELAMPRFPTDPALVAMSKKVSLCYTDLGYPLNFSERHFERALKETRMANPGHNMIFWNACKIEVQKKVKADLRQERARHKKRQEAKEMARALPPQPKKRRLRPSTDTMSRSLF